MDMLADLTNGQKLLGAIVIGLVLYYMIKGRKPSSSSSKSDRRPTDSGQK